MTPKRRDAIERLHKSLTPEQIADIVLVIETAETQGEYCRRDDDDGSVWEDDVHATLNYLGDEFRNLK